MGRQVTTLTDKEKKAEASYEKQLEPTSRKTDKQYLIGTVGLVGSGKSSVARKLAEEIGAVVVSADGLRIELRKLGEKYDNVWLIVENIVENLLYQGCNVIIDSDFVEAPKRASLRTVARRRKGLKLLFLRTTVDVDIMVERALNADYAGKEGEFFRGASSKAGEIARGAAVKVREMHRRTPLHYRWIREGGGKWRPRRFDFVFAEIDTTVPDKWMMVVSKLAKKL